MDTKNLLTHKMQQIILWASTKGEFESKDIKQFYKHAYNIYNSLNTFAKAGLIEKKRIKEKIKIKYSITEKGMVFAYILSSLDKEASDDFSRFLTESNTKIHWGIIR